MPGRRFGAPGDSVTTALQFVHAGVSFLSQTQLGQHLFSVLTGGWRHASHGWTRPVEAHAHAARGGAPPRAANGAPSNGALHNGHAGARTVGHELLGALNHPVIAIAHSAGLERIGL